MNKTHIIRAGFRSNSFTAGQAELNIAGTFSDEDTVDLIELLEMQIRNIKRQRDRNSAASSEPNPEPHPEAEIKGGDAK